MGNQKANNMKKIITAILPLLIVCAVSFKSPNQEKKLKFEFTVGQTELILTGLSKLPYEQSAQMIAIIQSQASQQMQPPPVPADTSKPKTQKKQ